MPGIPLQRGIVYGPVLSRRLGRSLGVNLMPITKKVCSFDCIYCQYGKTELHTLDPDPGILPSVSDVLEEIEKALRKPRTIDRLTLSGNGEPTLHPEFLEIVTGVRVLRDRYRPNAEIALLSNASRINSPDILKALDLIDLPMMKLDVGDPVSFKAINRPVEGIEFSALLRNLEAIPHLVLQCVLFGGEVTNAWGDAFKNWKDALTTLRPKKVLIYSTERPTALQGVECLPPEKLSQIRNELQKAHGLVVEAFWR